MSTQLELPGLITTSLRTHSPDCCAAASCACKCQQNRKVIHTSMSAQCKAVMFPATLRLHAVAAAGAALKSSLQAAPFPVVHLSSSIEACYARNCYSLLQAKSPRPPRHLIIRLAHRQAASRAPTTACDKAFCCTPGGSTFSPQPASSFSSYSTSCPPYSFTAASRQITTPLLGHTSHLQVIHIEPPARLLIQLVGHQLGPVQLHSSKQTNNIPTAWSHPTPANYLR
jgi:hypothetical protein